ncbi:hypothetical protein CWI38_1225p0020 [Hamiltosporidium tvaerminnensis]|uniref:Uncharacterized protein n=1 Tax=Hamiltosporidium tvaerminnensis TaxID=1176355 RepID=A0A4Q9LS65_9MICR|nr:hypothetical protein CWI38_1225p0020 [Hamiltosporidium tvaerminnensis]
MCDNKINIFNSLTWISIQVVAHMKNEADVYFIYLRFNLGGGLNYKIHKSDSINDANSHTINHLLFIDDLKPLATDSRGKGTLKVIEPESTMKSQPRMMRIMKDSRSNPTRSSFNEVQSKLISRVERLCHTRLNAKNLLSAINQHAISLINYHVGVVRLELANFSKLDDAVRAVIELGRDLNSVNMLEEELYNTRKNWLVSDYFAISRIEMYYGKQIKMLSHDYTRRYNKVITLVEFGITSKDSLRIVETERLGTGSHLKVCMMNQPLSLKRSEECVRRKNINEESDLEKEETVVIKEGRKIKSQREILTQNA